jgi:hypothetical protein
MREEVSNRLKYVTRGSQTTVFTKHYYDDAINGSDAGGTMDG